MSKYELTTVDTTALSSKALTKEVATMSKAFAEGTKAVWKVAVSLTNIVNRELWKDDFESLRKLYDFLGFDAGTATQYTKAVDFMKKHGFVETNKDGSLKVDTFKASQGVAYQLAKLENYDEFEKWFIENHSDESVLQYSVKGIRTLIKEYNEWKNPTKETKETEDTKETKETKEAEKPSEENNGIASKEDAIVAIKSLMEMWEITIEDLTESEAKEETKGKGKGKGKGKK